MVDLDDPIVAANALAQTHPFTATAFRYVRDMVARERTGQPVEELGVWAGHALTAGYCLRRVEEARTGRTAAAPEARSTSAEADDSETLDDTVRHVAELIRTDGAEPYLLWPEDKVVASLDRLIDGEIRRRVGHWRELVSDDNYAEICEYLAWWVIKGYALRVVECVC